MSQQRLAELEAQMAELVAMRAAEVSAARAIVRQQEKRIEDANSNFDHLAKPIGREIAALKAELEPETVTPVTPNKQSNPSRSIVLTGLSDEEQRHYRQLLAKTKGHK